MSKFQTLEELGKKLCVEDFKHLDRDKMLEFIRVLPQMEKSLSLEVIKNLDNKRELALDVIKRLKILCEEALGNNYDPNEIKGYQKALDSLDFMIRGNEASFEDQEYCLNELKKLSLKLNLGDDFASSLIEACGAPIGLVLIIGSAIFTYYE